ncbi:hypothetical protein D3C86_729670 [compost metagenome]
MSVEILSGHIFLSLWRLEESRGKAIGQPQIQFCCSWMIEYLALPVEGSAAVVHIKGRGLVRVFFRVIA